MEPNEPLRPPGSRRRSLVSRVSDHIAKRGREATVKPGKIAEKPSDEAVAQNLLAMEEFEARETAQQQLGELEAWVEKAGFSKREAQVYELDMLTDHNTKATAQKLQITDGQVRHHRMRYRDKLRTVRTAASP
jgi:DNA-binding CsgD family transcriptional regulator